MIPEFRYARPRSVAEAVDLLTQGEARIHAGGTDLLGCLHDQVFGVATVVSLSGIHGLQGLRETGDGGVGIGARTTITAVAESETLGRRYPALTQAAAEVGSPQLRHQGTVGGNLCQKPRCWYYRGEFPCTRKGGEKCFAVTGQNQFHCILGGRRCYIVHPSDLAPALVALGARVRATGPRGSRLIGLETFHVRPADDPHRETVLDPAEVLTEVLLPAPAEGLRSRYRKVRARRSWDFALAAVVLALTFDGDRITGGRVVLGGAAPFPWRSRPCEEALRGRKLDAATAREAAAAALADARPLAHNEYKVPLFQGLIEEELMALARS